VTVSRSGELRVEKIVLVMNSGYIIDPLNCAEQMEGAACWEQSHEWHGGLRLQGGKFTNLNFDFDAHRPDARGGNVISRRRRMAGGAASPNRAAPVPPAVANAISSQPANAFVRYRSTGMI
jgi:isoquinoline 1-oxidoreductase subunit beta